MSSIAKRPDGRWRARYRGPDGRERARHFDRKVDATRWLDEATAGIVTGQWVDPRAGRQTFRQYAEQWRAAQVHRPSSAAHVETMLRRHVYPVLGDLPLSSVVPSTVQAWVKGLVLAPSTVQVVHGIVAGVFRAAVRDRRIASNPCEGTRLPKRERHRVDPLTVEQVAALAEAAAPQWRACVVLGAGAGLRNGEALGLTVDRVDFLRRSLLVDRQLVTVPGTPPRLGPPKTAASVRTVPLPSVVLDELARHVERHGTGPDGLLFVGAQRQAMTRTAFGNLWRPLVARSGLPDGTRFHDLRHHYASLLIRHGESVKTVQARLGHASAAETLDTYSHLWPDSDDRTRDAVQGALGAALAGDLADQARTREVVQT
ncbi:tyrosine-type recombinase/integrase [Aquipuribacter sp. SD81]|uniref:tyrosine-type recombinase/integrase n=1 Tax=Aquipuribacter sp. SD81 TaxID=3127703 RepID=UPI00301B2F68